MKMKEKGFSLIELLVVLALFSVVTAAAFDLLRQGQTTMRQQTDLVRSENELRTSMDMIVRYVRQAGNDPKGYLRTNNLAALQVDAAGPSSLVIRSDVTGSVPSLTGNPAEATGDPDGLLTCIHEQVVVRKSGNDLLMDIGYGEQTLARDIRTFNVTFYDKFGRQISDPSQAMKAALELVGKDNLGLKSEVFLKRSSYYSFYQH